MVFGESISFKTVLVKKFETYRLTVRSSEKYEKKQEGIALLDYRLLKIKRNNSTGDVMPEFISENITIIFFYKV